jgi:hypothetical protein
MLFQIDTLAHREWSEVPGCAQQEWVGAASHKEVAGEGEEVSAISIFLLVTSADRPNLNWFLNNAI